LISTPTTGVDSILATYSLLGPVFTVFRALGSLVAGVLTGTVSNLFDRKKDEEVRAGDAGCPVCSDTSPHSHTVMEKLGASVRHAFYQLTGDIGKPLILGTLVGGVISYLLPENFFDRYLAGTWTPMLVMLLVGLPLYVCATGSIPIAASLILKGMSPGAGLVFLVAGPATNTVTISTVWKTMGKRSLVLYLTAIVITALFLGFLMDLLFRDRIWVDALMVHGGGLPIWLKFASGAVLLGLVLNSVIRKSLLGEERVEGENAMVFRVPDMTCEHCMNTLRRAIEKVPGVKSTGFNLKLKTVTVTGDFDEDSAKNAIRESGYEVEESDDVH
jgi:hypothetical protein